MWSGLGLQYYPLNTPKLFHREVEKPGLSHLAHNQEVSGSNPLFATIKTNKLI